ncbi:hypothetical protein FDP41_012725 [Naegleria fowleri]|uniref:CCAAT-binding factor domain-containing protein n=1 Tax=Naegleria fowleri TaxID=5763 RepID=A0A6A5BUQ0_NAEFO|nr:uncharacterized protein FDP41_012725 [Naegleria fowleri]KAF0980937.1 hypothetical protein FDP41_012725 [Naegleria fowleri]
MSKNKPSTTKTTTTPQSSSLASEKEEATVKPEDLFATGTSVDEFGNEDELVIDESIRKEEENENNSNATKTSEPDWSVQLRKEEQKLKQLIADSNCEIDESKTLTVLQVQELYSIAKKEHQQAQTNQDSEEGEQFEKEFVEKGTIMDKIAALSLLVQQKPIYRLQYIDELMKICHHPKNHRAAELAVKTCTDLFQNLLLTTRSLLNFKEREENGSSISSISMTSIYQATHHFERLNNKKKKKENMQQVGVVLASWYFEELLKKKYQSFINDVLAENIKEKANSLDVVVIRTMRNIRDLIKRSPERRDTLLTLLITKFADPKNSINARALYYLTALVNSRVENNPHYVPTLDKMYLCKGICEFLLNTKMDPSKRAFAASFLTNMTYTPDHDNHIAEFVLKSCMDVLKKEYGDLIANKKKKKKDEKKSSHQLTNSSFLGSLLSGMFKSLKHCRTAFLADAETLDLLFKIARITPLVTSVNACKLIYAIAFISNDEKVLTRFYTLLYDKLLDEGHTGSKVQTLLLVVYETVREDININRVAAFCKRLLQSCFTCYNPGYTAAVLMVLDQILKVKPGIHLSMLQQKNFLTKDSHSTAKSRNKSIEEDDEEEAFQDIDEETIQQEEKPKETIVLSKDNSVKIVDNEIVIEGFTNKNNDKKQSTTASSTTASNDKQDEKKKTIPSQKARGTNPFTEFSEYDPTTPKPEAANALSSGLWELDLIKHHFHPSVCEFVDNLVSRSGQPLYKGNPIVDFSTTTFIDKLMFKPFSKKSMKEKGSGLFSKSKSALAAEKLIRGTSSINSKEFADLPEELVKSDERFFHKFMVEKFKRKEDIEKEREAREKRRKEAKAREEEFLNAMDEDFGSDTDPFDELDDDAVMELLEQAEENAEDEEIIPGAKNDNAYGFDVTSVSEKPSQDEVAELLEEDEDELLEQEKQEFKETKTPSKKRKQKPSSTATPSNHQPQKKKVKRTRK